MRSLATGVALGLSVVGAAANHLPDKAAVTIHRGFLTGMDFRKLTMAEQRSYAAGIVDGMLLAPAFDAPKRDDFQPKAMAAASRIEWLETCVEGMDDEQVAAMISKWLRDHPERWHHTLHTSVYAAMLDSCPPLQTREK